MTDKIVQLFCLPFAGGSKASFKALADRIDVSVDVHIIEYPGRGTRIEEGFAKCWRELVQDAKKQIIEKRNKYIPFALLGYSMGTAIVYELLQHELEEEPIHVFLCARGAGGKFDRSVYISTHDEFIEEMRILGGIDKRIENDIRLIKYFTKPAYEDYKLLQEYTYNKRFGRPECDMTIMYCGKDMLFNEVETWKSRTNGQVDFVELGCNHFFIYSDVVKMAEIINDKIQR